MTVKMVLNNIPALKRALTGSALMPSARNGGLVIQGQARMYVPVDTAYLKNSIQVEESRTTATGAYVNIGSSAVYANIQELGGVIKPKTAKRLFWIGKDGKGHSANAVMIKAQPYMRPAVDNHKPSILSAVGAAIKMIVERAL